MLNLGTKTISHGPNMIKPRNRLYLITLQGSRTLALGGQYKDGSSWIYLDEVEELMEDNTWRVVGGWRWRGVAPGVWLCRLPWSVARLCEASDCT